MNARPAPDDEGLSLLEMIIYIVILGILTIGIGMIFVNTWKAQASVTDQTSATNRGQLISSQIEKAMRNAVDFEVTDPSLVSGTSGPVLVVATGLPGTNACMAFNLAGGQAQMTSRGVGLVPPPPWPSWQSGIAAHAGDPFFSQAGDAVDYSFDVTSTAGPTVHFEGTAAMRNPTGGTQSCFSS